MAGLTIDNRKWMPVELVAGRYGIPLQVLKHAARIGAIESRTLKVGRFEFRFIPTEISALLAQYYIPGIGITPHPSLRGNAEVNPADASAQIAEGQDY